MNNNVYFDYDTNNSSFVKMSFYLQNKGIINSNFMLKLYNKELAKIDPYSESLSDKEKSMIIEECKKNIWYFFRVILRIPKIMGEGTREYELYRGNMATIYSYEISTGLLKNQIRSTLSSYTNIAIAIYASIFRDEASLYICHDPNSIYQKIDHVIVLPSYIKELFDICTIKVISKDYDIRDLSITDSGDMFYSNYFIDEYEFMKQLSISRVYYTLIDIENHPERKVFFNSTINDCIDIEELYMIESNSIGISECQLYDKLEYINQIRDSIKCIFAMKFNTIGLDISKELADDFFKMFNEDEDTYRREVLLLRENNTTY